MQDFGFMSMDDLLKQMGEESVPVVPKKPKPKKEVKKEEPAKKEVKETKVQKKEEPKNEEIIRKSDDDITVEDIEKEVKETKKEAKSRKASKSGSAKKETKTEKPKDKADTMKFNGVLRVKVYGEELFTVTDASKTLEDIRDILVNDYNYSEFKDKTTCKMTLNPETGIVTPHIEFMKKG